MRSLLRHERRPGDFIFAVAFFICCLLLLSQLGSETKWVKGAKLFAQPAFWPTVSLIGMALFSLGHLAGSFLSERSPGRGTEALVWFQSLEYALWFMAYVVIVPYAGYLPATLAFTLAFTFRLGYRSRPMLLAAAATGFVTVVFFKSFLAAKIPGGAVYEVLPAALRNFMILNF